MKFTVFFSVGPLHKYQHYFQIIFSFDNQYAMSIFAFCWKGQHLLLTTSMKFPILHLHIPQLLFSTCSFILIVLI